MGTRQLTVVSCDFCAVEVVDDGGLKETKGWLFLRGTQDYGLKIRQSYSRPVLSVGHWCSIECYIESLTVAYTEAGANVEPYNKTH